MVLANRHAREDKALQHHVTKPRLQVAALVGFGSCVACVTILHFVRPDLPPPAHRLSEYANGPYGWLMAMAFVGLSGGLGALGARLWKGPADRSTWIAATAAVVAAAGSLVAGVFRTDTSPLNEAIHSGASTMAVLAVVILATVHTFTRPPGGDSHDPLAVVLAVSGAALVIVSPILHETRWTGLSQRLLWAALLLWLFRAASSISSGGNAHDQVGHRADH